MIKREFMNSWDFSEISVYVEDNHLALLGLAISMIALIAQLYASLKSKKKKYFVWHKKRNKQDSYYITKLMMVNKTGITIDSSSLSDADNLRIVPSSDTTIINTKTVYQAKQGINLKLSKATKKGVKLNFDYMDNDDGIIIEIKHKGNPDSQIKLLGSIMGVKQIKYINPKIPFFLRIFAFTLLSVICFMSVRELLGVLSIYSVSLYVLIALLIVFTWPRLYISAFRAINESGIYKTYNNF